MRCLAARPSRARQALAPARHFTQEAAVTIVHQPPTGFAGAPRQMYGVDQCRCCGKTIPVRSPKTREDQEKANRNPIVPEKVWRARGFLTAPTKQQWKISPANGCCYDCGRREIRRKLRSGWRVAFMFTFCVLLTIFIVSVFIYMRH
jgi:hypothetical protein